MKVLLLGFVRIATMPYMVDYARLLKDEHELHLVSWNRSEKPDLTAPDGVEKSFVFADHVEDEDSLFSKLPHIARYRRFVKKVIRQEHYDKIVVLHSTPGIALLDILKQNYRGKYLLDYRDVSHENLGFYKSLIADLASDAGCVIASSPAYFQYLGGSDRAILKHNLLREEEPKARRRGQQPIRIRYWGMIRHEKANLALIDEIGGDERFELHYNGREEAVAERLKAHVVGRGYANVFFHGSYYNDERLSFAADTDLIHNVYENDFVTRGAMGNKYYDGIQFKIPQLCTAGSIMGEMVAEKGLGIAIDYSKSRFADVIFDYIKQIDFASFDKACEEELRSVEKDNKRADKAILRFFER